MEHTFAASRKSKCGQRSNDPEYILGEEGIDFSLHRVWTVNCELRPSGSHNLLLPCPGKLTQNRLSD